MSSVIEKNFKEKNSLHSKNKIKYSFMQWQLSFPGGCNKYIFNIFKILSISKEDEKTK